MAIRYYALLYTKHATFENPSNVMRVVDRPFTVERLDLKNYEWVEDSNVAAHLFKGEPGAEPISAKAAERIIKRWKKEKA